MHTTWHMGMRHVVYLFELVLTSLQGPVNNCLAKWRLGARDIQELPLVIGSQLLDGDRSHGWQIQATQPWAPTRKEKKQAPVTLIKQWKEKEGTGEG